MAELADAYGSGPYGATRGGSSPLVSIADPSQMFAFEASNARAISLHPYYSLLLDLGNWCSSEARTVREKSDQKHVGGLFDEEVNSRKGELPEYAQSRCAPRFGHAENGRIRVRYRSSRLDFRLTI